MVGRRNIRDVKKYTRTASRNELPKAPLAKKQDVLHRTIDNVEWYSRNAGTHSQQKTLNSTDYKPNNRETWTAPEYTSKFVANLSETCKILESSACGYEKTADQITQSKHSEKRRQTWRAWYIGSPKKDKASGKSSSWVLCSFCNKQNNILSTLLKINQYRKREFWRNDTNGAESCDWTVHQR